jgi:hypothetical protein
MEDSKKDQINDEFITPEETTDEIQSPSQEKIDSQILAATEAAKTVEEATEIIKSQEEAYANRRSDEEIRWQEQEKKRAETEESTSKRLETLASTVLDAAEVANRAASSVTTSYKTLITSAKSLTTAAGKGNVRSTIVISITTAILFATAGLFGLVVYQMNKKIDQIDLMIVNLGTRSAELKNGLGGVESLSTQISSIQKGFESLRKSNNILGEKMAELSKIAQTDKGKQAELLADQTKKTNDESLKSVEKMIASVKSLEETLGKKLVLQEKTIKSQNQVTAKLAKELKKFEKQINKKLQSAITKASTLQDTAIELTKVKAEITALITLQQKRYLEALKAAVPSERKKQMIKYPAKVTSNDFPIKNKE